jgi:hypothetical protein
VLADIPIMRRYPAVAKLTFGEGGVFQTLIQSTDVHRRRFTVDRVFSIEKKYPAKSNTTGKQRNLGTSRRAEK